MSVGKLTRYGLPYSNVTAAGVATSNITPGRTLETLRLRLGGTALTKAMLTQIRVKANGKTIIEGTGSELDKINAYRGIAQDAAFLDLNFADFSMLSELDRQVGSFDTGAGIANITTEVTIAGATAPTLTPILIESGQQRDSVGNAAPFSGVMTKMLKYPFSIANGGRLPLVVPIGPQNGAVIKRLHVIHGGNMTGATVKEDGTVVHESVKAENELAQKAFGRVPQANMYTLDFVLDGSVRKALDTRTARSMEWLLDFSAADNGSVIVEYLDTLGNL